MEQPAIGVFGYLLYEPVTVITDLMLAGFCIYYANLTRKYHAIVWPYFFLLMAFATFTGAFGHGLFTDKNNQLQLISRMSAVIAVCVATLASIATIKFKAPVLLFQILALFEMGITLVLLYLKNDFLVVKYNSILGMGIFTGGIQVGNLFTGSSGSKYILAGIIINALAGAVHAAKLSVNEWFNHNDIGHFIMMLGLFTIAKGAIELSSSTQKEIIE